ncbi:UNVERIFIED_CONTAM: putative ribonuclease H protein [Sesamum radiatum]|uniref:Ribonuclease H protein n=1 Tax=Sesamum radiatum TaxID=300843 RepID=A0AAW2JQX2_SESRA
MIILWNILTSRNDAKHRKKPFNAHAIISKTWYHLQNLCRSNIWKPEHLRGWVKLNTDGASKGNPGVAGAGGIVRDYEGKVILAFSEPIGFTNNMVVVMHVVLRGLGIYLEKGLSKVWLELDALHVIHLIL